MTNDDFKTWMAHTAALLPMKSADHAATWCKLARRYILPYDLADAREAVNRLVAEGAGYQTEWLAGIRRELRAVLRERSVEEANRERGAADFKRSECIVCSDSGMIDLPWPDEKNVSREAVWLTTYTLGVYCACHKGKILWNQLASDRLAAEADDLKRRKPKKYSATTDDYTHWLMNHTGLDDVAAREWWYPVPHPQRPGARIMRQYLDRMLAKDIEAQAAAVQANMRSLPQRSGNIVAELLSRFGNA